MVARATVRRRVDVVVSFMCFLSIQPDPFRALHLVRTGTTESDNARRPIPGARPAPERRTHKLLSGAETAGPPRTDLAVES